MMNLVLLPVCNRTVNYQPFGNGEISSKSLIAYLKLEGRRARETIDILFKV